MGDWFSIIVRKRRTNNKSRKVEDPLSQKSKGSRKGKLLSGGSRKKDPFSNLPTEDVAATRIQSAFRSFKARKALRLLRGTSRLLSRTQNQSTKKQAMITMHYIHSWNEIQSEILARRLQMVTEGRIKQRKLESQLKVEAKLHDIEADWCGGFGTMEDIIARIQYREDAAIRRERALAYAFSHQWRPNSGQNQEHFIYELGKFNWGWSWMDRWIAARPWETRIHAQTSSRNKIKSANKVIRKTNPPCPSARTLPIPLNPSNPNSNGSAEHKSSSPSKYSSSSMPIPSDTNGESEG